MIEAERLYLVGPARSAKTARLSGRLRQLLEAGTRPDRILVLVPRHGAIERFRVVIQGISGIGRPRGEPDITTFYGLAQRHVALFFPNIAAAAGFSNSSKEPTFLNVELAQYLLNEIVEPHVAAFDELKLFRPRLLGQILDSMNKVAECGFDLDSIADRLAGAWGGDERRLTHYRTAQRLAQAFRASCLSHSFLDFSLLIEVFSRFLLSDAGYLGYVTARYRHVLVDNVEENPPVMHDFVARLLKTCDTCWLVEDDPGGFRLFLGADPSSARSLAAGCRVERAVPARVQETDTNERRSFGDLPGQIGTALANVLLTNEERHEQQQVDVGLTSAALSRPIATKYWIEMVREVGQHIISLVHNQGMVPANIAVIAPFVEDVLRFELGEQLGPHGIGVHAVRPSRPLNDHPAVRALITFAKLAHAQWQRPITTGELARALAVAIDGLDVARAQVLAGAALNVSSKSLAYVDDHATWERIGMRFHERFQRLVHVVSEAVGDENRGSYVPLDVFWQRLFGEVLSHDGYGFHVDLDAATAGHRVIRCMRMFREVHEELQTPDIEMDARDTGLAFISFLGEGILPSQYSPVTSTGMADLMAEENSVVLAPAFAYVTGDFQSKVQFWMDVHSPGWYERIRQPLTHPHVLSRRWVAGPGRAWEDHDEHEEQRIMLARLVCGLASRCETMIVPASSQLSVSGQENDGPLGRALQRIRVPKNRNQ